MKVCAASRRPLKRRSESELAQRPRHEARLTRRNERAAAVEPERWTRRVGGECAETGAPEIAVVARLWGPLAHLFACLNGSEGRSNKPGYYEGDSV